MNHKARFLLLILLTLSLSFTFTACEDNADNANNGGVSSGAKLATMTGKLDFLGSGKSKISMIVGSEKTKISAKIDVAKRQFVFDKLPAGAKSIFIDKDGDAFGPLPLKFAKSNTEDVLSTLIPDVDLFLDAFKDGESLQNLALGALRLVDDGSGHPYFTPENNPLSYFDTDGDGSADWMDSDIDGDGVDNSDDQDPWGDGYEDWDWEEECGDDWDQDGDGEGDWYDEDYDGGEEYWDTGEEWIEGCAEDDNTCWDAWDDNFCAEDPDACFDPGEGDDFCQIFPEDPLCAGGDTLNNPTNNPTNNLVDVCTEDPTSPECTGDDICIEFPEDPSCGGVDICVEDPTDPSCAGIDDACVMDPESLECYCMEFPDDIECT